MSWIIQTLPSVSQNLLLVCLIIKETHIRTYKYKFISFARERLKIGNNNYYKLVNNLISDQERFIRFKISLLMNNYSEQQRVVNRK